MGKKVTDFDEKVSGENGAVGLIESMYNASHVSGNWKSIDKSYIYRRVYVRV